MIKNFNPKTVIIGNYIWMAENLAIDDGEDGIFYNPENKEYYYTWDAAKRIASNLRFWRLPSSYHWNRAAFMCDAVEINNMYVKDVVNKEYRKINKLKTTLGIKLCGFHNGIFTNDGTDVNFWMYESSNNCAYSRDFDITDTMGTDYAYKYFGFSVRLIKPIIRYNPSDIEKQLRG